MIVRLPAAAPTCHLDRVIPMDRTVQMRVLLTGAKGWVDALLRRYVDGVPRLWVSLYSRDPYVDHCGWYEMHEVESLGR